MSRCRISTEASTTCSPRFSPVRKPGKPSHPPRVNHRCWGRRCPQATMRCGMSSRSPAGIGAERASDVCTYSLVSEASARMMSFSSSNGRRSRAKSPPASVRPRPGSTQVCASAATSHSKRSRRRPTPSVATASLVEMGESSLKPVPVMSSCRTSSLASDARKRTGSTVDSASCWRSRLSVSSCRYLPKRPVKAPAKSLPSTARFATPSQRRPTMSLSYAMPRAATRVGVRSTVTSKRTVESVPVGLSQTAV